MRILLALIPLGLLGWWAIDALGGHVLVAVLAVPGLLWPPALCMWIMDELRRAR